MLVESFKNSYTQYENFEVWDVENMEAFFKGNTILPEAFRIEFQMPLEDFEKRRDEIPQTNMQIMEKLLAQIGDKYFFIFTKLDTNHLELMMLQQQKVMNYGIDIGDIAEDHVYIMIMDKKASGPSTIPLN